MPSRAENFVALAGVLRFLSAMNIQVAVLCDAATDDHGKLNLLGAFDTIFAEGQRRFMESMSPYARQFVEQLPRPAIDRLTGIPPTVAIEVDRWEATDFPPHAPAPGHAWSSIASSSASLGAAMG